MLCSRVCSFDPNTDKEARIKPDIVAGSRCHGNNWSSRKGRREGGTEHRFPRGRTIRFVQTWRTEAPGQRSGELVAYDQEHEIVRSLFHRQIASRSGGISAKCGRTPAVEWRANICHSYACRDVSQLRSGGRDFRRDGPVRSSAVPETGNGFVRGAEPVHARCILRCNHRHHQQHCICSYYVINVSY